MDSTVVFIGAGAVGFYKGATEWERNTITPIKGGEFLKHERSTLLYLNGFGEKLITPITMYLIRGEGRTILVDTGCGDEAWAAKYHHPINQPESMKVLNALRDAGVDPEQLDCIVNTHLHWDHCFNNDLFPGQAHLRAKEGIGIRSEPGPDCTIRTTRPSTSVWFPPYLKSLDQYTVVEGDHNIFPGIDLVFLPGHTPGFQGVLVDTAGGKYLIASDCIGQFDNWRGMGIHKHIPPAIPCRSAGMLCDIR